MEGRFNQSRDKRPRKDLSTDRLHVMAWRGDDEELLAALKRGSEVGAAALFDRFGRDVNRLVWRFLGADDEHDDVVQQVFVQALSGVKRVRKAESLRSWIVAVAVNTVRVEIRRRGIRRCYQARLREWRPEMAHVDDHDARDALRRTYAVMDKLPAKERIVFVLRFFEGYTHEQMAAACGCSVPTIKRRLRRTGRRFGRLASRDPVLAERLRRGKRFEET